MFKKIFLVKQYFLYLLKAKTAHGIHSPFVFDLIKTVLEDKRHFYAFEEIEALRRHMHANTGTVEVLDLGAGSHTDNKQRRCIADIARYAGRNEKFGKLLFRLVQKYRPRKILELGTSLGIGTSYLARGCADATVYTIEGSPGIAEQASKHFKQLGLENIVQRTGNFDDVLLPVLEEMGDVDLVFIDGNHRKDPTLDYFQKMKPYLQEHSIVIFDDIHWSPGMQEAWDAIRKDPLVTLSIDVFFFGIVFFRKEMKERQEFVLRY